MDIIRPQFDRKEYEKVDLFNNENIKGFKFYLQNCSSNYSTFINYYFTRKGGVIDGFRYINA